MKLKTVTYTISVYFLSCSGSQKPTLSFTKAFTSQFTIEAHTVLSLKFDFQLRKGENQPLV